MKVGDKVKPSKLCRPLYGDSDYMIIVEIKNNKYLTNIYDIWFDKHELDVFERNSFSRVEVIQFLEKIMNLGMSVRQRQLQGNSQVISEEILDQWIKENL